MLAAKGLRDGVASMLAMMGRRMAKSNIMVRCYLSVYDKHYTDLSTPDGMAFHRHVRALQSGILYTGHARPGKSREQRLSHVSRTAYTCVEVYATFFTSQKRSCCFAELFIPECIMSHSNAGFLLRGWCSEKRHSLGSASPRLGFSQRCLLLDHTASTNISRSISHCSSVCCNVVQG